MTPSAPPRPPGRPKNEGKREAIIEAARGLFAEHVYESVTMEQVSGAAGVAKMTIYSHFQDKAALFEAMVRSNTDRMIASLPSAPQDGGGTEEALVALGCAFLGVMFSPNMIKSLPRHFDLLARNRALGEAFYNAGPGHMRATLTAYLRSVSERGDLAPDVDVAGACDLMSLWLGDTQQLMVLGLAAPMTQPEIERHVRRATQVFLKAYAAEVGGVVVDNEK